MTASLKNLKLSDPKHKERAEKYIKPSLLSQQFIDPHKRYLHINFIEGKNHNNKI